MFFRHVEFRYDLGSGPVTLRSNTEVSPGQWHHLVAKRYHKDGLLEIDGDRVTGSTSGSLRTLNVGEYTWVGGVNAASVTAARNAAQRTDVTAGFVGCLREFSLSRTAIALHSEQDPRVTERKNVVDCEENPCVRMPCSNGGSCAGSSVHQGFECTCPAAFTGK